MLHKSDPPFFSVVITTYNRMGLLKRALDSLLQQTETDWEGVIIDDGSTDQTENIIQPYIKQNKALSYFYKENDGFIEAKNSGIKRAKGKYITFLDSDDQYAENHLKSRKKLLLQHQGIDLLHGGVQIIGNQYVPDCNNPDEQIHLSKCVISGAFFVEKKAMRKLQKFKGDSLTTDDDFMTRAIQNKLKIMKTDLPTYKYYRDNEDSITNQLLLKSKVN